MAEYTEQMRRAWERSQAEGRARMQRLNEDMRLQQRSPAEKIYGGSSPDGAAQRLRSIAAGFAKGSRRR
jgi:hypothetical protein